jgi:uncharacterized protein YdcH (DUF465 family)
MTLHDVLYVFSAFCTTYLAVRHWRLSKRYDELAEFFELVRNERTDCTTKARAYLAEIDALKKQVIHLKDNRQSLELTEVLQDVKERGLSFIRVCPDSVFLRSPKEKKH